MTFDYSLTSSRGTTPRKQGKVNMNKVKQQILKNLQDALVECNMSDVPQDDDCSNDLCPSNCRQDGAYGFISQAIAEIGGREIVDFWIENGYFEEIA